MKNNIIIRKRKSVKKGFTYEYRFETASVNGQRKWISKGGFENEELARIEGVKALNEYNTCGKVVEPTSMSFADFLEHWVLNDCSATLNELTIINYRKKIKNLIVPTLGKYKVSSIDRDKLQNLLIDLHNNGYSSNTLERDGTAYFLYNTDSTPQPEGGPSAWGAAAVISTVDEGLAGIVDNGINYDKMYFSPKFPVTHYTELRYFTGYELSNTIVDVRYIMKAEGMRYDIISPAKTIQAHIFIPKGEKCSEVLVNSEKVSFEHICIAESEYVDFEITELQGTVRIEILFKK